jgi:hypothetical protein
LLRIAGKSSSVAKTPFLSTQPEDLYAIQIAARVTPTGEKRGPTARRCAVPPANFEAPGHDSRTAEDIRNIVFKYN